MKGHLIVLFTSEALSAMMHDFCKKQQLSICEIIRVIN